MLFDELGKFGYGYSVRTWCSPVRYDPLDRIAEILLIENPVHKVGYAQLTPCFMQDETIRTFGVLDFQSIGLKVVSQSFPLACHSILAFPPSVGCKLAFGPSQNLHRDVLWYYGLC